MTVADDPKKTEDGPSLTEQIRAVVQDVVKDVLGQGGGKKSETPAPEQSIAAQVEAAVKQVREGDERAKRRQQLEDRLAALEAKQSAPEPEKKPAEHRPITRRLWGSDDD